jgi:hypothetical protein
MIFMLPELSERDVTSLPALEAVDVVDCHATAEYDCDDESPHGQAIL